MYLSYIRLEIHSEIFEIGTLPGVNTLTLVLCILVTGITKYVLKMTPVELLRYYHTLHRPQ
jgi:hypothetical protein